MKEVNIYSWNMQGLGNDPMLKLGQLFSLIDNSNAHNIFCLQECGYLTAYKVLNQYCKAYNFNITKKIIDGTCQYVTATLTYYSKDSGPQTGPFVFQCLFAWNTDDKNKRCGTAILSTKHCNYIQYGHIDAQNVKARRPVVGMKFEDFAVFSMHANASGNARQQVEATVGCLLANKKTTILAGDFNHSPLKHGPLMGNNVIQRYDGNFVYFSNSRTQGVVPNYEPHRLRPLDFFISNRLFNYFQVSSYSSFEYESKNNPASSYDFGRETTNEMLRQGNIYGNFTEYEDLFEDYNKAPDYKVLDLPKKDGETFFQLSDHDIVKLKLFI